MSPATGVAPAQAAENLNVKLVYCTRQTNPTDPIHLAFSYTAEDGIEEILTAQVGIDDLFSLMEQQGWLNKAPTIRKMGLAARRAG